MNDLGVSETKPPPMGGRLELARRTNPLWKRSEAGKRIGVVGDPLIAPGASVFTLGSCFAQNIRLALTDSGHRAHPDYESIEIDTASQMAGPLGHINYYTTFSIRQEFERVLSPTFEAYHLPVKPGAWKIEDVGQSGAEPWEALFQDPLRHGVVAATEPGILDVMTKVDNLTRTAIESADAFILTLGLVESWIDTETDRHVWSARAATVSPDKDRFRFHRSDYGENYENMAWVCEAVAERFPGRPIIVTVSPVGLLRTFTDDDVVVANSYSKSVLRAVAGALSSEYSHVSYWPSYELAMAADVFKEDGRHVQREAVDHIVDTFLQAHASSGEGGS